MLEQTFSYTGPDSTTRTITVRIGDVRETHPGTANPWSALVEVLGFDHADTVRLRGRDWTEAIEDAARFVAIRVHDKMAAAGGGSLDPPLERRAV